MNFSMFNLAYLLGMNRVDNIVDSLVTSTSLNIITFMKVGFNAKLLNRLIGISFRTAYLINWQLCIHSVDAGWLGRVLLWHIFWILNLLHMKGWNKAITIMRNGQFCLCG